MKFEADAFISYAHLDDVPRTPEGDKGWVAYLHTALEKHLMYLLGKRPQVFRDPTLRGNEPFADTLVERLRKTAVLVPVVSPSYVKSEWTKKELDAFAKAAEEQGGVRIGDHTRIFKVLKTPVPLEKQAQELRDLLGYEFFRFDPQTGKPREFDEVFGEEAKRDFYTKLNDLAHDICCLLEMMEHPEEMVLSGSHAEAKAVFVAETTIDLVEQRNAIKRDLQQHGCVVLPSRPLPLVASEMRAAVREDLARCRMSIHLIGKNYSLVPEGGEESLHQIQNELAIERGEKGSFLRLLWIPPDLQTVDQRQRKFIEQLRMDPRNQRGADLLETYLEDLRTLIQDRLKPAPKPVGKPSNPAPAGENLVRLYLMYDQRDAELTFPWADYLFEQGFETIHPIFEGDETEIREYHEECLRTCDGALIFYGTGSECWLRRKLRELQKSAGYGRTKPMASAAIAVVPPKTPGKERFRTHEAMVIPQLDGFSLDPLNTFVSQWKAR